jgi:hypothetical protein
MRAEQLTAEESPFYVRWSPEHSRFAVELKLELVGKLAAELKAAEKLDVEIGGVLIGVVLSGRVPTVRIEAVEMIPRGADNGGIYIPGPDHLTRFAEIRKTARAQHRTALGFFRSHCRPGPLKPSLADRSLLDAEFKSAVNLLLLVQSAAPHTAAFFVAERGEWPEDASVREFRLSEDEFRALPEVEAETAGAEAPGSGRFPTNWYIGAALAGLVVVLAGFWLSSGGGIAMGSPRLDLKVAPSGHLLRISWNHDARQIGPASIGTVVIADSGSRREIKLGTDELKMGAVEYDGAGRRVEITMSVNTPGAPQLSESANWPQ